MTCSNKSLAPICTHPGKKQGVKMEKQQTPKKYILISLIVIILIGIIASVYWYTQIKLPYDNAVLRFENAAEEVSKKNDDAKSTISEVQKTIDSKEIPLANATLTDLQVAISEVKESSRKIPTQPSKTTEIVAKAKTLEKPLNYSDGLSKIEEKKIAFESSVAQMKQITNPTGDFVILRLRQIDSIVDIQGVTEDNDPNGNLNKQGGYTSTTYFTSGLVNQEDVYGNTVIERGTDGGGSIEVYASAEDAQKRDDYLSVFDGAALMMNPGSHSVIGTVVIRTSARLTASQQTDLDNQIKSKLTEVQ